MPKAAKLPASAPTNGTRNGIQRYPFPDGHLLPPSLEDPVTAMFQLPRTALFSVFSFLSMSSNFSSSTAPRTEYPRAEKEAAAPIAMAGLHHPPVTLRVMKKVMP